MSWEEVRPDGPNASTHAMGPAGGTTPIGLSNLSRGSKSKTKRTISLYQRNEKDVFMRPNLAVALVAGNVGRGLVAVFIVVGVAHPRRLRSKPLWTLSL